MSPNRPSRALAIGLAIVALGSFSARAQDAPPPAAVIDEARLAHLPIIEVPAEDDRGDTFVVLYSGDSGWGATARGFSAALAAAGQPVVGINALRYFLRRRSPEAAAADLAAVIEHYVNAWGRPRVILAGYSFGADSLPLIVEQLPPAERARVRAVALVSPADRADMAFRGLSWFDLTLPGARPLSPALLTLGSIPAVCIHAEHDPRAACGRFPPQAIASVGLPGWHRYRGEYQAVASIILVAAGLATPDAAARPAATDQPSPCRCDSPPP